MLNKAWEWIQNMYYCQSNKEKLHEIFKSVDDISSKLHKLDKRLVSIEDGITEISNDVGELKEEQRIIKKKVDS